MPNPRARRALVGRVRVVLGAGLVSALLVACSGGGGGGGGAGPSLSVTPSSTSVPPGGGTVTLHATLTGSTATPTWSIIGPGTLDTTSGTDVTYTAPSTIRGNEAATATVTANASGASGQAQIALAESSGPGHHWSTVMAPGTTWLDVKWGGGRFVAVGTSGQIVSSTDGTHWTHADMPDNTSWGAVAWGGAAGWVALGGDQHLATSPDGIAWTVQPTLPTNPVLGGLAFGNGVFVATRTSGSWVSTDGKAWTAVAAKLSGIAFGNGVFVGVAASGPVASIDGRTWPAAASADIASEYSNDGVAFGKGTFLASSSGRLSTSADGSTWTPVTPAPFGGAPTFAVDRFYVFSGGSSVDGRTWDSYPTYTHRIGATNADASVVVVTAEDDSTTPSNLALASGASVASVTPMLRGTLGWFNGIDCGIADCVAVSQDYAFRSADRTVWTASRITLWATRLMHVEPYGNLLVAGLNGNSVEMMTSLDGVDWLLADSPAQSGDSFGVAFTQGPNGLLAIAESGDVMTSPNGGTWSTVGHLPNNGTLGVAWGGGRYVAVGSPGMTATSPDGITWKGGTMPSDSGGEVTLYGVVYDGTQFVGVGERGRTATSPDGVIWTVHTTSSSEWLRAIAIGANGELVAVGDNGVVQTSGDGVHWTLRDSGTHRWLRAVAATSSGFLAAGQDNIILYSNN
jgi:hypothetical protein